MSSTGTTNLKASSLQPSMQSVDDAAGERADLIETIGYFAVALYLAIMLEARVRFVEGVELDDRYLAAIMRQLLASCTRTTSSKKPKVCGNVSYLAEKLLLPMFRAHAILPAEGRMDRTGLGSVFDRMPLDFAAETRNHVAAVFRSALGDWVRLVVVHQGLSGRADSSRAVSVVLAIVGDHTAWQLTEDSRLRNLAALAQEAMQARDGGGAAAAGAAGKAKAKPKGGAIDALPRPADVDPAFRAAVDSEEARWQRERAGEVAATRLPATTPATPFDRCNLVGELQALAAVYGFARVAVAVPPLDPELYAHKGANAVLAEATFRRLVLLADLVFAALPYPATAAGTAHGTMAYMAVLQLFREHRQRYRAFCAENGVDVPADGPDMPRDDAGNDNDGEDAADKGSDNEDDANKGSDDEDKEKEQPEATKEKKKKTSRPGPDARLLAALRKSEITGHDGLKPRPPKAVAPTPGTARVPPTVPVAAAVTAEIVERDIQHHGPSATLAARLRAVKTAKAEDAAKAPARKAAKAAAKAEREATAAAEAAARAQADALPPAERDALTREHAEVRKRERAAKAKATREANAARAAEAAAAGAAADSAPAAKGAV